MSHETPFSFHCMICFEEFDPEDRYPVVLPCGHTYVCSTCSERLDKCMECRTPLYYLVPVTNTAAPTATATRTTTTTTSSSSSAALTARSASWSSAARRLEQHNKGPPFQQNTKTRLPLPKNVVLLSLIEATELASQHVRNKGSPTQDEMNENGSDADSITTSPGASWTPGANVHTTPPQSSTRMMMMTTTTTTTPNTAASAGDIRSMGSMIDAEDDEEEKIKMGTSLAVGVAGTYAVAARDGLQIYPTKPDDTNANNNSTSNSMVVVDLEEDVDHLVNNFQLTDQHQQHLNNSNISSSADGGQQHTSTGGGGGALQSSPRNPARVSYGDRVQIVSLEPDGWAKLARGYGYARAEHGNLVKVGNALDRACKLEAILRSLSSRRKELRLEQTQIDNRFIQTMNRLQASLQNDEDLTVILADTFLSKSELHFPTQEEAEEEKEQRAPVSLPDSISLEKARIKEQEQQRQSTPPRSALTRFGCFSASVFDTGEQLFQETRAALPSIPPAALYEAFVPNSHTADEEHHPRIQSSVSHPSPSAIREGARAWRERHRQQPRTGIDFRTGMSGHKALYSPQARHPHAFLEPASSWTRLKMSSHTGLTTARTIKNAPPTIASMPSNSFLGSLAPSILGSHHQQSNADESRDQVPTFTGSM